MVEEARFLEAESGLTPPFPITPRLTIQAGLLLHPMLLTILAHVEPRKGERGSPISTIL